MPQNPKENFINLLRELFQFDNTDLDFGIYRILKLRSKNVHEFIDNALPQKLEEVKKGELSFEDRIITGEKHGQTYFIVWRKFDNELKTDDERKWILSIPYLDKNSLSYSNADNAFGTKSAEAEMKRLMFEGVD